MKKHDGWFSVSAEKSRSPSASASMTSPQGSNGEVIEADANGILDFAVPTADEPSCFFKIVAE